ncbi:MAG: class I SAM-dependent methyltransferase [Candidatus Nanopelagicaceae bacterium]
MKESTYWPEWQQNRIDYMIDLCGEDFFKGKTILELGPFNGFIGATFANKYGAKVKCIEGKPQNCEKIKEDYPFLDVECHNLDTPEWNHGHYDIIINFGLVYHLHYHHREHIHQCVNHCDTMFLETVTWDSPEDACMYRQENDYDGNPDQSMSDYGGAPSRILIENVFNSCPCIYTMFKDSKLNAGPHIYDWEEKNDRVQHNTKRRFWYVQKVKDGQEFSSNHND